MSLQYGFFNSYNGDRVYDAEQFSSFLDGIIYDGVYNAIGNKFYVTPGSGMSVQVDSGRAWFDHTWTYNSSKYTVSLSDADTVHPRIDAIVLEVNKTDRKNYLKVVKGTAAASPARPSLSKTSTKIQHALAYVKIPANASSIKQTDITYVVDTSETPLVSALALSGIPSGGTIGQVLAKSSSESGAVGWYDIDKLPHDKWYLANGVKEGDVLGAFKFTGRASQSDALNSINSGTSRTLATSSSSITWNTSNGIYLPAFTSLHNSSIFNANPSSVVVKFTEAPTNKASILASLGSSRQIFARTPYTYDGSGNHGNTGYGCYYGSITYSSDGSADQPVRASSTSQTSGILGCTFTGNSASMYFNGSSVSVAKITGISGGVGNSEFKKLIGMRDQETDSSGWSKPEKWSWGSVYIQYIAFYSTQLTPSQQSEIYRQINAES